MDSKHKENGKMGKLIIERSSEWNNMARAIGIYIDGRKVGTLAHGQTESFEMMPGKHAIRAKIDWCSSQILEMEFSDKEERTVRLSGFRYGNLILPTLLVLIVVLHVLGRSLNLGPEHWIWWLPMFTFTYPLYFMTLGRRHYLRLEEKKATS